MYVIGILSGVCDRFICHTQTEKDAMIICEKIRNSDIFRDKDYVQYYEVKMVTADKFDESIDEFKKLDERHCGHFIRRTADAKIKKLEDEINVLKIVGDASAYFK